MAKKAGVQFKALGLVPKEALPQRARTSVINALPIWDDLRELADSIRKNGSVPYEGYATIEVKNFPTLKALKRPLQSLQSKLRQFMRKNKIDGKLELISRRDEQTIYIGGVEE